MKTVKKVFMVIGLILLLCGGAVVIMYGFSSLYQEITKAPKLAEMYDGDIYILSPSFYACNLVDCDNPDDERNLEPYNYTIADCCTIKKAIDQGDPALCDGLDNKDNLSLCYMHSSWPNLENCLIYKTEGSTTCGIQTAVLSAYTHDRKGEEVWRWCFEIGNHGDTVSEFNSPILCLVGAAYHENDPSICENLSTESDIKECKKSAEYLIDNYQK